HHERLALARAAARTRQAHHARRHWPERRGEPDRLTMSGWHSPEARSEPAGPGPVEGRAGAAALALGAGGLLLTFTAPQHRVDLLAFGVLAVLGSVFWRPMLGPLLIGAALPFYFFGRPLAGPLAVSPPGLVLLLAWP